MHEELEDSLAFCLANKLSSPTLLPTNLMQMIHQAYTEEPVSPHLIILLLWLSMLREQT